MLQQRALAMRVKRAVKARGWLLFDAFNLVFDTDRNGLLSPSEVAAMLRHFCIDQPTASPPRALLSAGGGDDAMEDDAGGAAAAGSGGAVGVTNADVLEWIDAIDQDGDGNLSYAEFVEGVRDPEGADDDADEDDDDDGDGGDDDDDGDEGDGDAVMAGAPATRRDARKAAKLAAARALADEHVVPYSAAEEASLSDARTRRERAKLAEARAQEAADAAEEERVRRELEAWEDDEVCLRVLGRRRLGGGDRANAAAGKRGGASGASACNQKSVAVVVALAAAQT